MSLTRRSFLITTLAVVGPMVAGCQAVPSAGSSSATAPGPTATGAQTAPAGPAVAATTIRDAVVYGVASEPRLLNPLLSNDGASASVTQT